MTASGPQLVEGNSQVYVLADRTRVPALVAGWVGLGFDADTRLCLDESPRRCWPAPRAARFVDRYLENAAGPGPAKAAVLMFERGPSNDRFTVIRTLDGGEPGL